MIPHQLQPCRVEKKKAPSSAPEKIQGYMATRDTHTHTPCLLVSCLALLFFTPYIQLLLCICRLCMLTLTTSLKAVQRYFVAILRSLYKWCTSVCDLSTPIFITRHVHKITLRACEIGCTGAKIKRSCYTNNTCTHVVRLLQPFHCKL